MSFQVAVETARRIDQALEADQGATFRQYLQQVLPHMKDAYRGEDEGFRSHLGASMIGRECARSIWYGFRWAKKPVFKGRILRLFNRGHLEEARFIALLLTIGCQVYQQDQNGNQFRISELGGHFGGSGDGVALGVPDVPEGHACLLEFKTHNDKSFKKVKAEGVRSAKFEHYVQMQTYMRKMQLAYGLYGAVNKNDDDIHWEIIVLDTIIADQFLDRGRQLVLMPTPPTRINNSPSWFACSYCDFKAACHNEGELERNCRTCVHSVPEEDGRWMCTNRERRMELLFPATNPKDEDFSLSKERQLEACKFYEFDRRFWA